MYRFAFIGQVDTLLDKFGFAYLGRVTSRYPMCIYACMYVCMLLLVIEPLIGNGIATG